MIATIQEIESAVSEYREAMLEAIELDRKSDQIARLKTKSHKRISLARDELRAVRYN